MSKPKQHHYIHESYLESFTSGNAPFFVIDKWENCRIFPGTPKNAMKEAQYYSQPVYEEGRFDTKLETLFSAIEGHWPNLLTKIEKRNHLTDEDHLNFFETIAMLRVRVPNTRKAIEACLRKSVEDVSGISATDLPQELADQIRRASPIAAEKILNGTLTLKDMIAEKIINVGIDPHRSIGLMPQYSQSLAPTLSMIRYHSFLHNLTNVEFVTNDNPVLIYKASSNHSLPVPYPWKVKEDFCICFIVSPRVAYYYNSQEKLQLEHRNIRSANTVKKINELVALFADRFVVCSKKELTENFKTMKNFCPVPDFTNCQVDPEHIQKLSFEFGPPIKMNKWKYDFEDGK